MILTNNQRDMLRAIADKPDENSVRTLAQLMLILDAQIGDTVEVLDPDGR